MNDNGKIDVKDTLADQLKTEAKKHKYPCHNIWSEQLETAGYGLKNNSNIIITKTNKGSNELKTNFFKQM